MLTEKDYCDYDTCVALKKLGFREKCLTYYDTEDNVGLLYNTQWALDNTPYQFTDCLESHNAYEGDSYVDAPTLYEAQKWLREEKFLLIVVDRLLNGEYVFSVVDILNYSEEKNGTTNSYEEALAEGIKEAVKILKG